MYGRKNKEIVPKYYYAFTENNMVMYKNYSMMDYTVTDVFSIETERDLINAILRSNEKYESIFEIRNRDDFINDVLSRDTGRINAINAVREYIKRDGKGGAYSDGAQAGGNSDSNIPNGNGRRRTERRSYSRNGSRGKITDNNEPKFSKLPAYEERLLNGELFRGKSEKAVYEYTKDILAKMSSNLKADETAERIQKLYDDMQRSLETDKKFGVTVINNYEAYQNRAQELAKSKQYLD